MSYHRLQDEGFMRLDEVLKIFPVSKSHWWLGIKQGTHPEPVKLSPRITAWRNRDIRALLEKYDDGIRE